MGKRTRSSGSASDLQTRKPARKRQGFNLPKSAATKATITRNSLESPLLQLPREIRDQIWTAVLGDQILHVEWSKSVPRKLEAYYYVDPHEEKMRQAKIPVLGQSASSTSGLFPSDASPDWEFDLSANLSAVDSPKTENPQLQLLRICRQVYLEANPILWSTNILSFDSSSSFRVFVESRNGIQKKLLRNISFTIQDRTFYSWNQGFAKRTILSLRGLLKLQLYMDHALLHYLSRSSYRYLGFEAEGDLTENFEQRGVHKFQLLPLQHVKVFLREDPDPFITVGPDDVEWAKGFEKFLLAEPGTSWKVENSA